MSKVLTEAAASAAFGTGLTYPTPGESGSIWWDLIEGNVQQLADRSQAVQELLGISATNTRMISVPLTTALVNTSTRFSQATSGGPYWGQGSVASAGLLRFAVPPLPVGAVITRVRARWGNSANTTLPIQFPPKVGLSYSNIAVGTSFIDGVGDGTFTSTQVDTTAVVGTYQDLHNIDQILALTVDENSNYVIDFYGENGTNAVIGGVLAGLFVEVSLP